MTIYVRGEQNRATNNKHRPTDGRERRKKSLNQVNKLSIFDKLFTQHFTREREICIVYGSDQPARKRTQTTSENLWENQNIAGTRTHRPRTEKEGGKKHTEREYKTREQMKCASNVTQHTYKYIQHIKCHKHPITEIVLKLTQIIQLKILGRWL